MQLGNCRFDIDNGELINLDSGDVWHLPRAELQVLILLVEYQGKVVAKPLLKSGNGEGIPLSGPSVARAVFTLRSFLGPQYESLIETVKGQGYLLRHHRCRKHTGVTRQRFFQRFSKYIAAVSVIFILLFCIVWVSISNDDIPATLPLTVNTVDLLSGHQVKVILYSPSKTNNALLIKQGQQMQTSLGECSITTWDEVFLSLSHDKQVLNITLRGEHLGQSIIRNLKISDLRQPKQFISAEWLLKVDICG